MPPFIIDLKPEGSTEEINGAIFEDSENVNSGTGGYNTFLALFDQQGRGGGDGEEDGINADDPDPGNPEVDDAKTHTIQLNQLAVVTLETGTYFQFRLDINETEGGDRERISLDQFKLYTAASGTLKNLTELTGSGTLRYDMDAGLDVSLQLVKDSTGGGSDDYSVFIPTSLFDGLPGDTYLYLYAQMGVLGGDYEADSGFEEWRALSVGDVPAIEVDKVVSDIEDGDDYGASDQADSVGDVITYTITVDNVGNVGVTGVTVSDQVEGYAATDATYVSGDLDDDDILDTDETWTYTASYTLTQADLDGRGGGDGYLDNLATGDSVETPEDSDEASVELEYLPSIEVTKDVSSIDDTDDWGGTGQLDSVGDTVNYTITIANTGNVSLTNVEVEDLLEGNASTLTQTGDGNGDDVLDVGETWTYTTSYTITQADLDGEGGGDGSLDNVATGDTEETEEDTDTESVDLVYLPSILVTKDVDSIDDTDDFGGTGQLDSEGDTVNYVITIANTGNISLTNVVVGDVVEAYDPSTLTLVDDGNGDDVLDVGETWTYTASYSITQDDLDGRGGGDGFLDNVATGDTEETEPDTDTESVELKYLPSIDIEKLVSVDGGLTYTDEDDPTGPAVAENVDTIYFKFVVVNNGNISLSDVTVTDDKFDLDAGLGTSWVIGDLAPGGSDELIITAPWVIGQHVNTGTVTTNIPEVTDSDLAHYFGVEGPGVRTPGFWQSKFGLQFWDGIDNNEAKGGLDGFADGELTKVVDSNGNGSIDTRGFLVGDYSGDGIENFGENTLFISIDAAKILINASDKDVQDGRFVVGRDLVATWLNYLAGNPIGPDDPDDDPLTPRDVIDLAVSWLQTHGDPDDDGITKSGSKIDWDGAGPVKPGTSAFWNGDGQGNDIHGWLDEYNNDGSINGTPYANDADSSFFITVLNFL